MRPSYECLAVDFNHVGEEVVSVVVDIGGHGQGEGGRKPRENSDKRRRQGKSLRQIDGSGGAPYFIFCFNPELVWGKKPQEVVYIHRVPHVYSL